MYIEKKIDDLTIEKFVFTTYSVSDRGVLYLDEYYLLQRESTKKRTYQTLKCYKRLSQRDSTISEAGVPLTEEIKKEALEKFFSGIKVLKWSEK